MTRFQLKKSKCKDIETYKNYINLQGNLKLKAKLKKIKKHKILIFNKTKNCLQDILTT